jgi:hypothetical protein
MALKKEELTTFVNNFRYLIDQYVQYFGIYYELLKKSNKTTVEEHEFKLIQELLLSIGEILVIAVRTLGDDLFGKAIDLYYHYKQIAVNGDPKAQYIVNELKPLVNLRLSSRMTMN